MSAFLDQIVRLDLPTCRVGRRILGFDVIDSTNTYALEHGRDGDVIVAERQTLGRGRLGRVWHSPPGLGLWFTAVLEGPWRGLQFAAALAVRDAAADRCALKVKWPNDLLLEGRKVCGILVEDRNGRVAVGIGINVHHRIEDFPEGLRGKAGSLEALTGVRWDRVDLLRNVLTHLDQNVMLLTEGRFDEVRGRWAEACALRGRAVQCGDVRGTVQAIDEDGALLIDTPAGRRRIVSGDLDIVNGDH